jgi:hypothetical protein
MKTFATLATAGLLLAPGMATAACDYMKDQTAQISCADGQTYDAATRSCVPTTS